MKLDIKTFIVLVAIILVAAVGSAYVTSIVFSSRQLSGNVGSTGEAAASSPDLKWDGELIWHAGSFTVNLQPVGGALSFIKTSVSLRASAKNTVEELEQRKVQVNDRLITILRTTLKSELDTEEGISDLKRRIMDGVNELVQESDGQVVDVYFSELVTQ